MHLVLECLASQDVQVPFAPFSQQVTTRPQPMWQPVYVRVARFPFTSFCGGSRRMREIDPSDDSGSSSARVADTDLDGQM